MGFIGNIGQSRDIICFDISSSIQKGYSVNCPNMVPRSIFPLNKEYLEISVFSVRIFSHKILAKASHSECIMCNKW